MKNALVLLAPGFEEIEAVTIIDLLRRADIEVVVASVSDEYVTGSHDITLKADTVLKTTHEFNFDIVILPGGIPGTPNLANSNLVIDLLKKQAEGNKLIAAICAAPTVLKKAGLLKQKKVTSHPSEQKAFSNSDYRTDNVVMDGNIITSRAVGTAIEFSLYLIEKLCGSEKATEIGGKILFKKEPGL